VRAGADRYDGVAQSFHWVVVLLVNAWHLAIGPTVLLLMLLRLLWRLTHRTPAPPSDLPRSLRLLSRATHWLFYAALIVLPVLGWIAASGYGARVTLLRLVPLPALIAPDKSLAESVGSIHGALAWALLAVIALHVSGALYHALVKRDGVVGRMLPMAGAGRP